jgi:hypothetical protein
VHTVVSADTPSNVQPCVSATAKTFGGADPKAAPVMGDGAPAKGDAPTEDDRDEAEDEVEDFVWGGSEQTQQRNRDSRVHTVVSAATPSNVQPCVSGNDRDEADDEVEDFVWGGSEKTP